MEWKHGVYELVTSDGAGGPSEATWRVVVGPGSAGVIERRIYVDGEPWDAAAHGWCPEPTIWPAWSPGFGADAGSGAPLQGVHDYWSDAGDRLRDSAKWLAAVIGAALAALVGTSPLADIWQHRPPGRALLLAAGGIVLLGLTLLLVLQVIRPQSVSFADVQSAGRGPLRRWRRVVEEQQDLYLPTGVSTLTALRQSMIIEEVTLVALARATEDAGTEAVEPAQRARAARLKELRDAAARVATIGEFYRVRNRSSHATGWGLACGLVGTILIVVAFAWPRS